MSSENIAITFNNIFTRSIYDTQLDKYAQSPRKPVETTIPRDVAESLLQLNLYILKPLISDSHLHPSAINASIKSLYERFSNELFKYVKPDTEFMGYNVRDTVVQLQEIFRQLCSDQKLIRCCKEISQFMETIQPQCSEIKSLLGDDLKVSSGLSPEVLKKVIELCLNLNGRVYPKYSSGLLPFLITLAFIFVSKPIEDYQKEDLFKLATLSHFQKIIYDSKVNTMMENYIVQRVGGGTFEQIIRKIKRDREMKSIFHSLSLASVQSDIGKTESSLSIMYSQAESKVHQIAKKMDYWGIDINLDLFPYMFSYKLPLYVQKRHYFYAKINTLINKAKHCERAKLEMKNFDLHFDAILFPTRDVIMAATAKVIEKHPEYQTKYLFNDNDFDLKLLDSVFPIIHEIIPTFSQKKSTPSNVEQEIKDAISKLETKSAE